MWTDVVIGTGDRRASAYHVFDIPGEHGISENDVSFWISDCFLDSSVTIFKNTKEGKELQSIIDQKKSLNEIQEWLDLLVLFNMDPTRLKQKIMLAVSDAKKKGRREKAEEFRKLLKSD